MSKIYGKRNGVRVKMCNKNTLLAKEIFIKYGGSHFHMEREGEYEYYKSLGITEEQERLWINEYQQQLFVKVDAENIISPLFSELTSIIRRNINVNGLGMLLKLVERKRNEADTFTQMRMAEEILSIVESFLNSTENSNIILDAQQLALDILHGITIKPITVASYYKNIGYLKDAIKEENIIKRVQRLIKACQGDGVVDSNLQPKVR